MRNYRDRTAIELAAIATLVGIMVFFIKPGESGEDLRKIHSGVDCTRCHAPVADLTSDDGIPDPGAQCATCHDQARLNSNTRLPFHQSPTRPCVECHSFHKPDVINIKGQTFHLRFQHQGSQALCGSCHAGNQDMRYLSVGHQRAAALFHSDNQILTGISASDACMTCHLASGQNNSLAASISDLAVPKFEQHGHPVSVAVVPGSGVGANRIRMQLDPRIPLFDRKIECATCHSLGSTSRYLLTGSLTPTELCRGCHELN
jgi:predicted CXXCH cytochrome family protein